MGGESVLAMFLKADTKCETSTSFNNTFLRAQAALTKIILGNNNKNYKIITINTEHFNIGGGESMMGWMAPLYHFNVLLPSRPGTSLSAFTVFSLATGTTVWGCI